MQIPNALVNELFLNPELKKSDTRTVIFLLQNPGALSNDELAAGIGVSRKSVNKSINRLIAAKVIQPGEFQAKKRTLNIHAREIIEPSVTEESNKVRFDRLEAMIGTLMDTKWGGLNPTPIHDGQNETRKGSSLSCMENMEPIKDPNGIEAGHKVTQAVTISAPAEEQKNTQAETMPVNGQNDTGIMPVCSQVDEGKNIQDKKEPLNIPNRTTGTKQAINGTQTDPIMAELDNALLNTGARLAALKAASLLKDKQSSFSDTCAPASIGEVFKGLFGVNVPPGFTDMAAVETMVSRKNAGKLDNVKSPIAYLNSLSGKVQTPILTAKNSAARNNPLPVNETSFDDYTQRSKIKAAWFGLNDEQRMPFHELREKKAMSGIPGRKVPVELLAFQQFTQECLAGRVKI